MTRIVNQTRIRGELQAVFDLVTTARHWTLWHPATLAVSGQVYAPLKLGDVVRERARIGGEVAEGEWKVTEWEPLRRLALEMPGTRLGNLKIVYEFRAAGPEVEFSRELVYDTAALPAAAAERIAAQMKSDSEIAVRQIKEMVEGGEYAKQL